MEVYIEVKGVNKLLADMIKKSVSISKNGTTLGMYLAGLHLQRTSQEMVPVETGNLKGLAFTESLTLGGTDVVLVGYRTSPYALYVHEQVAMKWRGKIRKGTRADGSPRRGRYWDPQGKAGAKFLERPFTSEFTVMMKIIEDSARKALLKP